MRIAHAHSAFPVFISRAGLLVISLARAYRSPIRSGSTVLSGTNYGAWWLFYQ